MTDLRKAAEMALEACEHLHRTGDTQVFDLCYADKVIPALRQALAQPDEVLAEREACAKVADKVVEGKLWFNDLPAAIRARSEKPPVKSYCGGKPNYCTPDPNVDAVNMSQERIDETAKREHEPLVWMNKYGHVASFQNEEYKDPLYAAPPKREWVGLTDEEIKEIVGPWGDTPIKGYTRKLFDQIEAKLKEKNGG